MTTFLWFQAGMSIFGITMNIAGMCAERTTKIDRQNKAISVYFNGAVLAWTAWLLTN